MIATAQIPPELVPVVRQVLALKSVPGFIAAYERNLAVLKNKTAAYEATEAEYEFWNDGQRRYNYIESFWTTLSRHDNEQKEKAPAS